MRVRTLVAVRNAQGDHSPRSVAIRLMRAARREGHRDEAVTTMMRRTGDRPHFLILNGGPRVPQNQDLSDTMHGPGIDALGQRVAQRGALLAILDGDGDLDQFVRAERTVDFCDEFRCHAGMTDAHDWFERVRASFQPSPFTRGERCRHPRIVVALSGQNLVTAVIPRNGNLAGSGRTGIWCARDAGSRRPCPFSRFVMHALSKDARFILDRMEPDRCYEALDLRALVPDASAEGFREVMHELWVNRQVERVGYSGWLRHLSAPAHQAPIDGKHDAGGVAPVSDFRQTKVVKPEDLFDHGSFADFFR
jgi:hypothetical protein